MHEQILTLDPAIRDWVLLPIMLVMVLIGILRHNITQLLNSPPPPSTLKAIREAQALVRVRSLVAHAATAPSLPKYGSRGNQQDKHELKHQLHLIPPASFTARKQHVIAAIDANAYLKNPNASSGPPNPITDPAGMEQMMSGMKKNMAMIVPQTIIMSWITFFFSGFVLIKLPFPLTLRFKAMLQRGIETADMDVTWVSSLSWYFLNLFGLRGIFALILGEDNAADGVKDMQAMHQPNAAMGQQIDYRALLKGERENLELAVYEWGLDGVEERVLHKYAKSKPQEHIGKKVV